MYDYHGLQGWWGSFKVAHIEWSIREHKECYVRTHISLTELTPFRVWEHPRKAHLKEQVSNFSPLTWTCESNRHNETLGRDRDKRRRLWEHKFVRWYPAVLLCSVVLDYINSQTWGPVFESLVIEGFRTQVFLGDGERVCLRVMLQKKKVCKVMHHWGH